MLTSPFKADAKFIVATDNYRAFGGGNFPGLGAEKVVFDAPAENRQALVEHLTLVEVLTPGKAVNPSADGSWRILSVSGVKMNFRSASAASKYLANHPGIRLIRNNWDGSALYELVQW